MDALLHEMENISGINDEIDALMEYIEVNHAAASLKCMSPSNFMQMVSLELDLNVENYYFTSLSDVCPFISESSRNTISPGAMGSVWPIGDAAIMRSINGYLEYDEDETETSFRTVI